jgi:Family of unknown function (DUF6252)
MKTMKNVLIIFLMSLTVMACNKSDDDGGDDPQVATGTFKAQVDGASFEGIEGTVVAQVNSGTLSISGGTSDSENLQMIIVSFDGTGTYPLNFTNLGTYSYLPDPSNPDPNTVVVYTTVGDATGNNGELKVSSYDGNIIKGTFTFTGFNLDDMSDTVSVTSGQFEIEVTQQ